MHSVLWKEYGYIPLDDISYAEARFLVNMAFTRRDNMDAELESDRQKMDLRAIINKNT